MLRGAPTLVDTPRPPPIVVAPRVDPTTTTTTRFVEPPGWTGTGNPGPTQRTDTTQSQRELTANATSGVIPVVYGRSKVGGQIILIHLQGDYLYAAAAFSEGPIDGYETILVDGKAFTTATLYTGTNSQGVDATLAGLTLVGGSWDTGLPGLAYVVCKIPIADVQGFPAITAIIRGKKYRDPRITPVSGTFLDYANRVYGANPVLIIADLLTDNLYGAQFPDAKLNWTGTISDSADYCDDDIAPANPVAALTISLHTGGGSLGAGTYSYKYTRIDSTDNETSASPASNIVTAAAGDYITISGFGTQPAGTTLVTLYRCVAGNAVSGPWKILAAEPATTTTINDPNPDSNLGTTLPPGSKIQTHRFEFNGVLQQAANLAEWIDTLRSHCQAAVPFNGVTYDIICDRPWTVDPVHVFTADDIVGDSLQVVRAGFDAVPTAVEITYTDAQNDFVDARCIREIAAVTAGTEDRRTSTYALKGCTSADQSQRHAVYFLNKRTSDITISFQTFQTGLLIENGDVFAITHPIGFSAALFRAEKVGLDADGGGWTISGREYSSLVYVDYVLEADPVTSTVLPDPIVTSVLDDYASTSLNTPVVIDVLANDVAGSLGALTIFSVTQPFIAGSTVTTDGATATYTPATGFVGYDYFTYTVRGYGGTLFGATVTVTVGVNVALSGNAATGSVGTVTASIGGGMSGDAMALQIRDSAGTTVLDTLHTFSESLAVQPRWLAATDGVWPPKTDNYVITEGSTSPPANPRTGRAMAWLRGWEQVGTDTLSQVIAVPSGAAASLTLYLKIPSADTGIVSNDTLDIQIRDAPGTSVLATLGTYSNLDRTTYSSYQLLTFDVSAYLGTTIMVYLTATEDATLATSFLVDDFSLTVDGGSNLILNPGFEDEWEWHHYTYDVSSHIGSTIALWLAASFDASDWTLFDIDDVSLTVDGGSNLVLNPGFETDSSGASPPTNWTTAVTGDGNAGSGNPEGDQGGHSGIVIGTLASFASTGTARMSQVITIPAGAAATLGLWVRVFHAGINNLGF